MWITARRTFWGFGAMLGLLVYALQFQKACGDSTPVQCVAGFVGWMQQGMLAPRQKLADVPPGKQDPQPVEPAKVAQPPLETGTAPRPTTPSTQTVREASAKSTPPPGRGGQDRRLTLINSGNVTMMEFFATRCSVDHWGRDLLGRDVIQGGQQYVVDLDDG